MEDVLSIRIRNETYRAAGIGGGEWLKLPATAEQLHEAMRRVDINADNPQDFHISRIETPVAALARIPIENVRLNGLDELNYLAAALQSRDERQMNKLNAASEIMPGSDDVHGLLELTQNTDCYDYHPDIFNHVQLGEHTLEYSGLIQIPDEWVAAIDVEMLGRLAAENEKGRFSELGYVVSNGDIWKPVYEIPPQYRIMSYPQPERDDPNIDYEIATSTPAVAPPLPVKVITLESENPADKLKEITGRLESGIAGIFESDQYRDYLNTLSKFHNYSLNNTILIAMQKPDASRVAGFNTWKNEFERNVRKGEKGIKILAPSPFKIKKDMEKIDPATQRPVIGGDGKPVTEEIEVTIPAFKVVSVFDVSQTDGKELPAIGVDVLTGDVEQYRDFYAALEKASPFPIAFEEIGGGVKGYANYEEQRIAIRGDMSELQTLKTAIHEISHARLHDHINNEQEQPRADRNTREVQAESIAYTVCQYYGLDTSDYSFAYVAEWSSGRELAELKASLETVRTTAAQLITEIDGHFAELQQDREQTAEITAPEQQPGIETWSEPATPENAPDTPGEPSDDVADYLPPTQDEQPQQDTGAEQATGEPQTGTTYYAINETAARRAKEANSYSDYRPGSATAEYRQYVDEATALAERHKARVDPMHHERIDRLLNSYCRKLAENMNNRFAIDSRVPSIMIAGPSNFPVRQKEKQNAARDRNWGEWQEIQGLLDKIRSTGMGGISADDPNAIPKLQEKLAGLEQSQETMKAVNAHYRKHKTLDGCPDLNADQIARLKADMSRSWRGENARPFEAWALSNNNAEIHRTKSRIEDLQHRDEAVLSGWQFEGGKVEVNKPDNRLQIFFDGKPDEATRAKLKGNGFRWAPSVGAWQRQLNANAFYAANNIKSIQPLTGEKPTDLQRRARREADAARQDGQVAPE